MQDRTLTLVQEDGKEIICDILFTYHWDKLNKDYVVFQVRGANEVSAAVYFPKENGEGHLERVETEEEWTMLEELLNDYAASFDDAEEGGCQSCGGCSSQSSCGGCSGCGSN